MTIEINLGLVWAIAGGTTDPGDAKFQTGWISEIPTFQHFNYVLKGHSANLLALAEKGTFAWQGDINYVIGSEVVEDGIKYYCKTGHLDQKPSTDTTSSYWSKAPVLGATNTAPKEWGMSLREIVSRPSGTLWTSSDQTIENSSPLLQLNTLNAGQTNWLFGNISGKLVAVDLGTTPTADGRNIALTEADVHKIFHEGNKPTQSDVSGTIPSNPTDGKMYARRDTNWVEVTSTIVSDEPPPPVEGNGTGWYNLADGKFYIDIDDGDSSQWVPANPPQIPVAKAQDVTYDDAETGLGEDLQEAVDGLFSKIGRKNYLTNGNFDVWQRGSSGVSQNFGPDRWFIGSQGVACTWQKQASPERNLAILGVAGNTLTQLTQKIESKNTYRLVGKDVTLRGRVYDSIGGRDLAINLYHADGLDDFSTVTELSSAQSITTALGWNEITLTVSNLPQEVKNGLMVIVGLADLTVGYFEFDWVQLEDGSVATPPEHRPIAEELVLCQRYYEKSYNQDVSLGTITNTGSVLSTVLIGGYHARVDFLVLKRVTPAITLYNNVTGVAGSVRNGSTNTNEAGSTNTAGQRSFMFIGTNTVVSHRYSAHFAADSELY